MSIQLSSTNYLLNMCLPPLPLSATLPPSPLSSLPPPCLPIGQFSLMNKCLAA